jgi:hypothetical protein
MTKYLIRSMGISPYLVASRGWEPQPYHTYLLKPERRWPRQQLWSVYCGDVQQFDSVDDALAHGAAVLDDERFDVVPVIDLDLPSYWDAREGNPRARVIGTEIVREQ